MNKKAIIFGALFTFIHNCLGEIRNIDHQIKLEYNLHALNATDTIIPIVVVGAGVAGYMAASYAARSKLTTYVITGPNPGGQLASAREVENMPGYKPTSGYEITENLAAQAHYFGAQVITDEVLSCDLTTWPFKLELNDNKTIYAMTVIFATGSAPRTLNIPGEQEYWGSGVSTCALCDCFMYKDQEVIVVGGGDTAAEQALILAPYASKITIFVRKDRMRATPLLQDRLREYDHISIVYNQEVVEVLGNGDHVTGVTLQNALNFEKTFFPCFGMVLAIGHNPNSALVAPYLALSNTGYILLAPSSQETSIRGVFAAGDNADHRFRQAGIAVGSGIQAALEALDFLRSIGITERSVKNWIKPPISLAR